jgi:predicted nuclease with TOPRIM domain
MPVKEAYLERVVGEVEKLADKVAYLKTRLAREGEGLQLRYYWELEYLRKRFAEFKQRVEELEEADDSRSKALFESVELIWRDLEHSIEGLLRGLP